MYCIAYVHSHVLCTHRDSHGCVVYSQRQSWMCCVLTETVMDVLCTHRNSHGCVVYSQRQSWMCCVLTDTDTHTHTHTNLHVWAGSRIRQTCASTVLYCSTVPSACMSLVVYGGVYALITYMEHPLASLQLIFKFLNDDRLIVRRVQKEVSLLWYF